MSGNKTNNIRHRHDGGTGGIRCHLFITTGQSVRAVERTYDTTYGVPRRVARRKSATRGSKACATPRENIHLVEGKITIDDIAAMCGHDVLLGRVHGRRWDELISVHHVVRHASRRQGNEGCVGAGEEE